METRILDLLLHELWEAHLWPHFNRFGNDDERTDYRDDVSLVMLAMVSKGVRARVACLLRTCQQNTCPYCLGQEKKKQSLTLQEDVVRYVMDQCDWVMCCLETASMN